MLIIKHIPIGSLVVCLPLPHKGGELVVYGDTTRDADTSSKNNNNNDVIPVKRKTREERAHRLFDFGSPPTATATATATTTTEKVLGL